MSFANIFSHKEKEEKKPIIIADIHERNALVISLLIKKGIDVHIESLKTGDYIVGDIAIERKTVADLSSSIINKRILEQLNNLVQHKKYALLVEGNLASTQKILHKNALRGFLLSTALDRKIPVIITESAEETAENLTILARRTKKSPSSLRPSRIATNAKEQIRYLLEGFPGIGPAAVQTIENHYTSFKEFANTSLEQLEKAIGKKAILVHTLLNKEFNKET